MYPCARATVRKKYCAAVWCNNFAGCRVDEPFALFSFPKDERRAEWVKFTLRSDLGNKTPQQLSNLQLCSDHFHPSQFRTLYPRILLQKDANPSIIEKIITGHITQHYQKRHNLQSAVLLPVCSPEGNSTENVIAEHEIGQTTQHGQERHNVQSAVLLPVCSSDGNSMENVIAEHKIDINCWESQVPGMPMQCDKAEEGAADPAMCRTPNREDISNNAAVHTPSCQDCTVFPPIVTLTWDDHHRMITSIFTKLLEDHIAVDCTIVAGGQRIKVHQVVLSSFSSFFELLFKEENEHPTIILTDTNFRDLRALIHYMYHGKLEIPRYRVKGVLETAKYLEIKGLGDTCEDKVGPRDDTFLTQNAHSSELDRHGDICDGDRITCQRTGDETNLGLFASTRVKRENTDAECDLPNELFHSELDLKVEDVPQEDRGTPGSASVRAVKQGETLSGDGHSTEDVRQGAGTWNSVASVSDGPSLSLLQIPVCVEAKTQTQTEFSIARKSAKVTEKKRNNDIRHTSNICPECRQTFCRGSLLKNHMRIHKGLIPYNSGSSGRAVKGKYHLKNPENNSGKERVYKYNERAYSKSNLLDHIRIHTKEKRFKCSVCDYSTAQKSNLLQHTRVHTGDKPFKCPECDYSSVEKGHLLRHIRIHTGEKPFKCADCAYSAAEKNSLIYHTRKHSGEKPFKCAECNYRTAVRSSLNTHTRLHTGEKLFKCSECDYRAYNKFNLKRHIRIHTGEKPFQCAKCD